MAGERRAKLLAVIQGAMAETQGQGAIFGNAVAERLGLSSTELETLGVLDVQGPLPAQIRSIGSPVQAPSAGAHLALHPT